MSWRDRVPPPLGQQLREMRRGSRRRACGACGKVEGGRVGASFPQIHRWVGGAPNVILEESLGKRSARRRVVGRFDEIMIVWFLPAKSEEGDSVFVEIDFTAH